MNSMIDPQNEIAPLATVASNEVYDGPDCDDVAQPHYDGPADDTEMYPQDIEQDEFPWWAHDPQGSFFLDIGNLDAPSPP